MDEKKLHSPEQDDNAVAQEPTAKSAWQEPKLTFVKPTLIKHGELTNVTGGFFNVFTP